MGKEAVMSVNDICETREEEIAMAWARETLDKLPAGHALTCGELADKMARDFPGIVSRRCTSLAYEAICLASLRNKDSDIELPKPRTCCDAGSGRTNWEKCFSSPLRAAETMAKAREVCMNEAVGCDDCPLRDAPICLADPSSSSGSEEQLIEWMESKASS